jgi:hypothetical protein
MQKGENFEIFSEGVLVENMDGKRCVLDSQYTIWYLKNRDPVSDRNGEIAEC